MTIKGASIKGFQLKNIHHYDGNEGRVYQGSVYHNNKRIGSWSQDVNGAICDDFYLEGDWEQKLGKIAKDYLQCDMMAKEIFMSKVLDLTLEYKDYKKYSKKFETPYIAFVSHQHRYEMLICAYDEGDKAVETLKALYIRRYLIKDLSSKDQLKKDFDMINCKLYSCEEDFCIK